MHVAYTPHIGSSIAFCSHKTQATSATSVYSTWTRNNGQGWWWVYAWCSLYADMVSINCEYAERLSYRIIAHRIHCRYTMRRVPIWDFMWRICTIGVILQCMLFNWNLLPLCVPIQNMPALTTVIQGLQRMTIMTFCTKYTSFSSLKPRLSTWKNLRTFHAESLGMRLAQPTYHYQQRKTVVLTSRVLIHIMFLHLSGFKVPKILYVLSAF